MYTQLEEDKKELISLLDTLNKESDNYLDLLKRSTCPVEKKYLQDSYLLAQAYLEMVYGAYESLLERGDK